EPEGGPAGRVPRGSLAVRASRERPLAVVAGSFGQHLAPASPAFAIGAGPLGAGRTQYTQSVQCRWRGRGIELAHGGRGGADGPRLGALSRRTVDDPSEA